MRGKNGMSKSLPLINHLHTRTFLYKPLILHNMTRLGKTRQSVRNADLVEKKKKICHHWQLSHKKWQYN